MIVRLLRTVDQFLRKGAWTAKAGDPSLPLWMVLLLVVLGGSFYGAVMGTYSGLLLGRIWQLVYSAIKVPLLLLATFSLSVPSFFVINTLFGLRDDFQRVLHSLIATQAGVTVILASLAPLTIVWYFSSDDYNQAILFNGVMFGTASLAGQGMLISYYRPLIAREPRHRWMMRTWFLIYAFVGIQMGWVLRPFIGAPNMPVRFFREESWGNAYEVVLRLIWTVLFAESTQ